MSSKTFLAAVDRLNASVGIWASLLILPMMAVGVWEVVARFIFNRPTVWGVETTSLVFGAMVALLGGFALLHGQHVRVDVLFERLSKRGKAIVDTATSAFGFIFIVALLWYSLLAAITSVKEREVAETVFAPPIYPLRVIMVVGVLLLLLQMIVKLVRDIQLISESSHNSTNGEDAK